MDQARGLEIDRLRGDIAATRASISQTVSALRYQVREAMDWQTYVERYPAAALAGAVVVGLVLGRVVARSFGPNGHGLETGWSPGGERVTGGGRPAAAGVGSQVGAAARASWHRLGSHVESLVNRVIDEVAEAAERTLVPALVGGAQTLFEGRHTSTLNGPAAGNPGSEAPIRGRSGR